MKNISVLFCAVLYLTQVYCIIESVVHFLENTATNITRVRTPVERDRQWRDFAVLDFVGLVHQYDGYSAEEYDVQTIDGYILKLHRISGSPLSPKVPGKSPVYIGHGITFLLADAGYDVWVGNSRGNSYSNRHIKYSTEANSYDFWNCSLDEMALIDLPLFIDTILAMTNKQKLTYIGYSMGGTLSFILLSTKPEYNEKINVVLNMAPAVIFTHPLDRFMKVFTAAVPQIKEIFPVLFSCVPSGTSLYTVDHYYQMMISGKFRPYDYGMATNRAKYNVASPPEYNLSRVTSPQAIFYAEQDRYVGRRNAAALKSRLPNVVAFEEAPKNYNHIDFVLNVNAKEAVYYKILDIIAKYL